MDIPLLGLQPLHKYSIKLFECSGSKRSLFSNILKYCIIGLAASHCQKICNVTLFSSLCQLKVEINSAVVLYMC